MSLNREDYLTEEEVAKFLGLARRTLMKNRSLRKRHPAFIKIGKIILYPKKDFEKWLQSQIRHKEIQAD